MRYTAICHFITFYYSFLHSFPAWNKNIQYQERYALLQLNRQDIRNWRQHTQQPVHHERNACASQKITAGNQSRHLRHDLRFDAQIHTPGIYSRKSACQKVDVHAGLELSPPSGLIFSLFIRGLPPLEKFFIQHFLYFFPEPHGHLSFLSVILSHPYFA